VHVHWRVVPPEEYQLSICHVLTQRAAAHVGQTPKTYECRSVPFPALLKVTLAPR
jgi:hypothetical protein